MDADGDGTLEFYSHQPSVITVDGSGRVEIVSAGTAQVTNYGGAFASFDIEVKEVPVSSVTLPETLSIYRGKEQKLDAVVLPINASNPSLVWKSDNTVVATVDNNGVVKAKAAGTATITAASVNGIQAECIVTVMVPAVSIQLSKGSLTMKAENSATLTAEILPLESTESVQWSSSNTKVADVYEGTVIAKAAGTATITASTDSGLSATCKVTVQKSTDQEIKDAKAAKAKIKSAKNNKKKGITVKLSGLSGCDGYQIQYGLKKNFKGAKNVKKKSGTVTLKNLKLKKTYYIRVRTYKKIAETTYYGKWSSKKSVKIKK